MLQRKSNRPMDHRPIWGRRGRQRSACRAGCTQVLGIDPVVGPVGLDLARPLLSLANKLALPFFTGMRVLWRERGSLTVLNLLPALLIT